MPTLRVAILGLVVWFVWGSLARAWEQFDRYEWAMAPGWAVLSGGAYLVGLLPAGLFWYLALRGMGQPARLGWTLRAYYIGHLGKYVPGKAMVVILRAGMLIGQRVSLGVAAASVFLETLTWLAVGSFWAAVYLVVTARDQVGQLLAALGLMAAALMPTLPPVFKALARLAGVGRWDPAAWEKLRRLDWYTLFTGWVLMGIGWAVIGLSYWAALRSMGLSDAGLLWQWPRLSAAVALATVAGFMVLFLPAGLGVREAALASLMIPSFRRIVGEPELVAWVSAAVLRVVCVVSEVLISGILYGLGLYGHGSTPPKG
ncbi:MAG: lysylphosphatidylglycerol synthase domain-containing protein [Thermoguttaceae bacterium]